MPTRALTPVLPHLRSRAALSRAGGTGTDTVLPQGAGYGIVLGFGVFFSVFTSLLVYLDTKYGGTKMTSEQFNTAGRSVKTGLSASVIVSQWTWAATLLQSSNVAWQYGVSGPFWYAAGASIQVRACVPIAGRVALAARAACTHSPYPHARAPRPAPAAGRAFCVHAARAAGQLRGQLLQPPAPPPDLKTARCCSSGYLQSK